MECQVKSLLRAKNNPYFFSGKGVGKTERTIWRLVKKWRDDGLVGLTQTDRSDKGSSRLDEDWQKFILKTYKEGNQGSKRMTRKQVAVMVKAKAEELQVKPPSHMSVYTARSLILDDTVNGGSNDTFVGSQIGKGEKKACQ
jgi:hypothetical protein